MIEYRYDTQLLIEGKNLDEDKIRDYFCFGVATFLQFHPQRVLSSIYATILILQTRLQNSHIWNCFINFSESLIILYVSQHTLNFMCAKIKKHTDS